MKFQRLTIVRLCSPAVVPEDSPDDERIQAEHIARRRRNARAHSAVPAAE